VYLAIRRMALGLLPSGWQLIFDLPVLAAAVFVPFWFTSDELPASMPVRTSAQSLSQEQIR
jgi:hypothetical protein